MIILKRVSHLPLLPVLLDRWLNRISLTWLDTEAGPASLVFCACLGGNYCSLAELSASRNSNLGSGSQSPDV